MADDVGMSVDLYNEEVCYAPKACGACNFKNLAAIGSFCYRVGVRRLVGQHFCLFRVQVDRGQGAFVAHGEVALFEILGHDFGFAEETGFNEFLLFEFAFASDFVISSVEIF